jgi:predicted nucleic acid-binding protein
VNYLLDTCVISELAAKQPNEQVVRWIDSIDPDSAYLSVITIGEIRKGIERLPKSNRKKDLLTWLDDALLVRFRDHLVALDVDVLLAWGVLTAQLELKGRKMPAIDSLIAATAIHGGFALVTRNEADFAGTGVTILNPWK